jgi:hypothetical protein
LLSERNNFDVRDANTFDAAGFGLKSQKVSLLKVVTV